MIKTFDKSKKYRVSDEYLKSMTGGSFCSGINRKIPDHIGSRIWSPVDITSTGCVSKIFMHDTKTYIVPRDLGENFATGYILFTKYELQGNSIVEVENEDYMVIVNDNGTYKVVHDDDNDVFFTENYAKTLVTALVKLNPDCTYRILKTDSVAKAKITEIDVIFE